MLRITSSDCLAHMLFVLLGVAVRHSLIIYGVRESRRTDDLYGGQFLGSWPEFILNSSSEQGISLWLYQSKISPLGIYHS